MQTENDKTRWMQTHLNKKFDFNLVGTQWGPSQIYINDIAHHLSMICRFNGATSRFYSVAEHSFWCSVWCDRYNPDTALAALLHDAAEAYVGDISAPLKSFASDIKELEKLIWKDIADRFFVTWHMPDEIKHIDLRMLITERNQLMGLPPEDWQIEAKPLPIRLSCWGPEEAKNMFLNRYHSLSNDR